MTEWRLIKGWPYSVSADGAVRNDRTGRTLKPDTMKGGYHRVTLCHGGRTRRFFVNRLVCEAFHGPAPGGHQARHLNGHAGDNAAANLAWGSRSTNEHDKRAHGTYQEGAGNPFAKLSDAAVQAIRAAHAADLAARKVCGFVRASNGLRQRLAAQFNVTDSCIHAVVGRLNWSHL